MITTNCAILGLALFQTNRGYDFSQSLAYALGAGAGFTLALLLISGIRERLALRSVPEAARGLAITLVVAGILSLAFMGFAGMGAAMPGGAVVVSARRISSSGFIVGMLREQVGGRVPGLDTPVDG